MRPAWTRRWLRGLLTLNLSHRAGNLGLSFGWLILAPSLSSCSFFCSSWWFWLFHQRSESSAVVWMGFWCGGIAPRALLGLILEFLRLVQTHQLPRAAFMDEEVLQWPLRPAELPHLPSSSTVSLQTWCAAFLQHSGPAAGYLSGHHGSSVPMCWCGQACLELIFSQSPAADCALCFGQVLSSGGLAPSGGNGGTSAFTQGGEVLPQTNSTSASYWGRLR